MGFRVSVIHNGAHGDIEICSVEDMELARSLVARSIDQIELRQSKRGDKEPSIHDLRELRELDILKAMLSRMGARLLKSS